ncbi:Hypothetical predicted protein [Mytilus galloprovincialis]|uniref:Uncharacterized protein n=1 Tax=Mytilus galloprovincialis TaxID=29158 RepID=A0A8B6G0M8_MYTGA|nr:Hypothetical predicted protein [Mytilus galloprovincialis]
MVQKKIANLKDFSTQTDLSIPIDCEVLVVEDQIPEPVKSLPAPNHEASLQKKNRNIRKILCKCCGVPQELTGDMFMEMCVIKSFEKGGVICGSNRKMWPTILKVLCSIVKSGDIEQAIECQEGKGLPHLKLLPTTLIYHEITNADPILANVPSGPQNNKYFKIDKSTNAIRGNRQRSTFYDDCGVWDSSFGNTVKTYHVVCESTSQVTKKEGQYCIAQKRKEILSFIRLNPQPSETDIVTLHNFYTALTKETIRTRKE